MIPYSVIQNSIIECILLVSRGGVFKCPERARNMDYMMCVMFRPGYIFRNFGEAFWHTFFEKVNIDVRMFLPRRT